jgi:hypothetical protein
VRRILMRWRSWPGRADPSSYPRPGRSEAAEPVGATASSRPT